MLGQLGQMKDRDWSGMRKHLGWISSERNAILLWAPLLCRERGRNFHFKNSKGTPRGPPGKLDLFSLHLRNTGEGSMFISKRMQVQWLRIEVVVLEWACRNSHAPGRKNCLGSAWVLPRMAFARRKGTPTVRVCVGWTPRKAEAVRGWGRMGA